MDIIINIILIGLAIVLLPIIFMTAMTAGILLLGIICAPFIYLYDFLDRAIQSVLDYLKS